jgi:hypothetical protein
VARSRKRGILNPTGILKLRTPFVMSEQQGQATAPFDLKTETDPVPETGIIFLFLDCRQLQEFIIYIYIYT